jgi:hypothetical protein
MLATTLAVQDTSQSKLHYGKEQAEVIMNIVGNIISGQVSGDTAKQLSGKFYKTDKVLLSIGMIHQLPNPNNWSLPFQSIKYLPYPAVNL